NARRLLLPSVYQGASITRVCVTRTAIQRNGVTFPDRTRRHCERGSWCGMRRRIDGYGQRSASGAIDIYDADIAAKRSKCGRRSGKLPSDATEAYTWNRHGCVVAAIGDGFVRRDLV